MMNVNPSEDMIEDQISEAYEQENKGRSKFPGMTYEQGVIAGIEWVLGDRDVSETPMSE